MIESRIEAREILIHGDIGGPESGSETFARMLAALGDGPVTVGINSRGGNVMQGIGIYNLIKGRPGVTTRNDGLAASIASVIFCAGERRVAAPASFVVVHRAWADVAGNDEEINEEARNLKTITDTLIGAYCTVCKKPRGDMEAALNNRKWFTAEEALEWGLATEVTESSAAKNLSAVLGEYFNSIQLPARHNPKNNMEEMKAELAALKEKAAKMEADLKASAETIAARDTEIKGIREANAKAFAKAAVAAGRIKAELESKWAALHLSDAANAEALLPEAPKAAGGNGPIPLGDGKETSASDVLKAFNAMSPGPERSAYFAKNRALIMG